MLHSLCNIHVKTPFKNSCSHAKRMTEGNLQKKKTHTQTISRDFISIQVLPTAQCVEYSK